jgi:C4-dicarboxylate transporter DctM subunit
MVDGISVSIKKGWQNKWTTVENVVASAFLAFGMLLMFYQVLSRYFLGFSVYWAEELVRYLIIWSNFIGASMIIMKDEHISVSYFLDKFKDQHKILINQFTNILNLIYSAMLAYTGAILVFEACMSKYVSDSRMETPMWIPYIILPLAGLLIGGRWIQKIVTTKMPEGWHKDIFTYGLIAVGAVLTYYIFVSSNPLALMLIGMFLLMFMGMPIAFAMGLMGSIVLAVFDMISWSSIASKQFWSTNSFTMLAIPFFIFTGSIIAKTPMGECIIDLACYLLKKLRGGIGIAIMIAAIIFASMSGSSVATAAALGMIAIPMLKKAGYPDDFSAGMMGAGGTLAVIVPPSSILVLYGAVSGASISDLFVAGTIPGVALCGILCIYVYYRARKGKFGEAEAHSEFSWKVAFQKFKKAFWALLVPLVIMGTIYAGLATPTEAAVVASVYAIIISFVVYRGITFQDIYQVTKKSVEMSAMIYAIIMSSALFGFIISMEQIPQRLIELIASYNIGPFAFLMLLNLLIPIIGFFLGPAAIIVMIVPIVVPIANYLGISLIHLGLLMALNMEMDFIMPPLGTNLYVLSGVAKIPVGKVIKGVAPFIVIMLLALILVTLFPQISLFALK